MSIKADHFDLSINSICFHNCQGSYWLWEKSNEDVVLFKTSDYFGERIKAKYNVLTKRQGSIELVFSEIVSSDLLKLLMESDITAGQALACARPFWIRVLCLQP